MEINQLNFDNAYRNYDLPKFPHDCKKIQKIAKEIGLNITIVQAEKIWQNYSGTSIKIDDRDIKDAIRNFIEEYNEEREDAI